jgi:2-polyprenyl-6-methoxyphenol hydroxylase-like FAD-dependent oxidoreductase
MTRTTSSTVVIGAAITGPSAALKLAMMGHDVTVYEARPEDDLASAGILGITHGNWQLARDHGVDVDRFELTNWFRDYSAAERVRSPFRYITWTGLHRALVNAGQVNGVRYQFGQHITPEEMPASTLVVDATGVAGAARRDLPHHYSGTTIYRGLAVGQYIGESFVTFHGNQQAGEYLTIGDTPTGAFWAYFVPRAHMTNLRTVKMNRAPAELRHLPGEFRPIIRATREVFRTPISDWVVPGRMATSDLCRFTVGDVNGPVRPVTTSGANLAMMEGLAMDDLLDPYHTQDTQAMMLQRRQYDLDLGRRLDGPEIGGVAEDVMYAQHHRALFGELNS